MRRDDDVEIPSMTLDQDEVSERRQKSDVPKTRPTPSPAKPAHAPAVVHKKQSLFGIYLLLFLILVFSAAAGFWLWQQNQQLRNELYGAKSEIENLDHQLLAADVSANEQGQTVEQTLKTHESEIRKLWGVSYDRNRKTIAENSDAVDLLKQQIKTLKSDLSTQAKRIAYQDDAFSDLEAAYNKLLPTVAEMDGLTKELSTQVKSQSDKIQQQSVQLTRVDENLNEQKGATQALALSIESVSQELSRLQNQLNTVEEKASTSNASDLTQVQQTLKQQQEAIQSSDAFRSQVNAEIIRLRKQINQLMLEQQLNAQ
ncbi:hypothetical protein DFP76_105314 [Marinomonas aquiplantarum]|uniref:Uncharacterized protein n=2 Tax=Marinomonas aquiplantarum TaxID=491951 RepID=A0A366CYB9_9GAMM|nr:hypothetical protein DFP76_105314 [Marinomonas aquiplantarum]